MPRKKEYPEKINVKVSREMYERMETLKKETGLTFSEMVRYAMFSAFDVLDNFNPCETKKR